MPERTHTPPARPLCWLAGALGTGTLLGLAASEGQALAAGTLTVALALVAEVLARRDKGPPWIPALLLLAHWNASAAGEPPVDAPALRAVGASALREAPVVGIWRSSRAGRTGWVEPFAGAERTPGHGLLFEPTLVAPESGTPVALLPGGEVLPWARGPEPAPGSRGQRFSALSTFEPDELVRLAPGPPQAARALLDALRRLRARLGQRVATLEREHSTGLLRALLTGERADLDAERTDLFARTGTSHLLAISGWHVSVFAALVLLPLTRAWRRTGGKERTFLVRVLALLLFTAVAGAGKPVWRATLALLLGEVGALRGGSAHAPPRRPDGLSFLSAAFACECLFDPAGVRSLSLALSYAATLGLALGAGSGRVLLRRADEPWGDLGRGPCARVLRAVAARFGAGFGSGLVASSAAVLATLPLVWANFGEFAPAGALLTLLALPPFTLLCLLAWLGALVPWSGLAAPADFAARALYAVLELGDALPGTPLVLPPRPAPLLALATLLVFLGFRQAWARRVAALTWGTLLLPWSAAARGFELHALDVGHGSALVLRAPGLEALVFDAGSRDRRAVASEALIPLLARWEVARPVVVLSHPDLDHSSGLVRLAERFPLRAFLGAEPAQAPVRLPHGAERLDIELGRGRLDSGCAELGLTLLCGSDEPGNEGSRALEVRWRGDRLLLLGDAEEAGLRRLPTAPGPLRLLLAPHHGSDLPALGPLLDVWQPAEVWVSNSTLPAIARELDRRRMRWAWTGRDGPLALRLP